MRYGLFLLLSIGFVLFAQGAISDTSSGLRPKQRAQKHLSVETIEVEEELSAEEQAAAREAALQMPYIDDDGEVTVPRAKKTRTVMKLKEDHFAPPEAIANDPTQLVEWFCDAWIQGTYERLYYAMLPSYRKRVSYETFQKYFTDDAALTGGLKQVQIDTTKILGTTTEVKLRLEFQGEHVPTRRVRVLFKRTPKGFRLEDSGLIPKHY